MVRLADLRSRSSSKSNSERVDGDELLVLDWRGEMTPAQMVEQKFLRLLESKASTAGSQANQAAPMGQAILES